jgi:PhnB protein
VSRHSHHRLTAPGCRLRDHNAAPGQLPGDWRSSRDTRGLPQERELAGEFPEPCDYERSRFMTESAEARRLHTGTLPILPVADVPSAIDWYTTVLGFGKLFDVPLPDGTVVTGQVQRAGNNIMFNLNPAEASGKGGGIYLWCRVEDADLDALYQEFQSKGVQVVDEIQDQFWGDRYFAVRDLNGYILAFNKSLPKQ